MALTKYRLGDLIEQCNERDNGTHVVEDVRGISTGKEFIETKANMDGVSLSSYKVVRPGEFAYVADTSRRGDKIALAFNASEHEVLISSIYTAFRVKSRLLLSDYLFMFFNRPEFDRFSRFNSWGSARETFDWNDFCDIDIALPPVSIQQKYVDIYNAMLANQQSYEHGLADLKLVCDAYIEDLRKKRPIEAIGPYIERHNIKNGPNGTKNVMGVSTSKEFREPSAKVNRDELSNYKVVKPRQISFVQTTHNEKVFAYGTDKEVDGVVINDKCKALAQKVKEIIDTKSSFADWLNNQNVRNQLKLEIKICLVKNGYPPQYSPEVFKKVMEQVENFEENN